MRRRIQSDLGRFPAVGPPLENTRAAVRITRQTGQVQTASVSPDGSEIAYLSDSGGHGNVWVTSIDSRRRARSRSSAAQPSPSVCRSGRRRARKSYSSTAATALRGPFGVRADGSGMRELVKIGIGASWSGDNRWLYYALNSDRLQCIQNLHASVADVDSDIMLLDGLLR